MLLLLGTGFDTGTLTSFPPFLSSSLVYITTSFSSFSERYLCTEMEKNKNLQNKIQIWEHYAMVLQAAKLCIISVKIYAVVMVKETFEIKGNI